MCVVPQVLELYSILGSWDLVNDVAGLDDRHSRRIRNEPGVAGRVNTETRARIAAALEERRPFPLRVLRKAREMLTELKANPGTDKLENYILVLEGFLHSHEPADRKLLLEYKYMRMMTCMSKALHHGQKASWFGGRWGEHLRDAEANAEEGMAVADSILKEDQTDERTEHLRGFLFINWVQIIQEQVKAHYPGRNGRVMTIEEKETLFENKKALPFLKELMIKFPYLWQAPFNGLEQASSLRKDEFALWFYNKLKWLDPGFQDFDYSPGEVLAISAEPGMAYFNAKYRDKLHIPNPKK